MAIRTMDDLFIHGLQDIYYAENQIAKTLPQMMEKSSDPMLLEGLRAHLEETQPQITRLDQVSQALGRDLARHNEARGPNQDEEQRHGALDRRQGPAPAFGFLMTRA